MAYHQQATMQYHHQMQHHAHIPPMNVGNIPIAPNPTNGSIVHHNIMNAAGQMNLMSRSYLQQNGHAPAGTITASTSTTGSKTLELKVISPDMTPRSAQVFPGDYAKNAGAYSAFTAMPPKDRYLMQLVEVFTFQIRGKTRPGEPAVLENASLYYNRLKDMKSKLCNDMDQVVGFRCCGCRQIANNNGNGYIRGAAQLIIVSSNFNSNEVGRALESIREHMLQCQHITESIKTALRPATPINQTNHAPQQYLRIWMHALQRFSQNHGYPKMNQPSNAAANHHHHNQLSRGLFPQGTFYNNNNNNNALSHASAITDTEDIVRGELEDSITQGLIANNYGVARVKPRIIASDLSEYPISKPHEVLPILELLLQSLCAVQRWRTSPLPATSPASAAAGEKCSNQELLSEQPTAHPRATTTTGGKNLSNVFFECNYCKKHCLCVSTATGRETADFILTSFCNHLCDECEYVPIELEAKLIKMSEGMSDVQRSLQTTLIEKNLKSWKASFPENTRGGASKKRSTKRLLQQSTSWRPLTWKFLEENTAACIADASLANKGPSAYLVAAEPKQLTFAPGRDDVLFGWNGKHVGNRRFLDLLSEARPAFGDKGRTLEQKKILACEVMRVIGRRGGRFYYINANPMFPPILMSPEQAMYMIYDTMKRGNSVLLQTRPNPTKRGRASCVLECDVAPQRSLFGKEIVRNKRFKKCPPKEEIARAVGQR